MLSPSRPPIRHALHYGDATRPLAEIVADALWPGMYRIAWPSGELSDLASLTRAKDAAALITERGPPRRDPRRFHWKLETAEATP